MSPSPNRTFLSPDPRWAGQYAVANSAGLVLVEDERFQTHAQAKRRASEHAMSGWMGECWPVKLTTAKGENCAKH